MSDPLSPIDDLSPIEEQAFDALLDESLGQSEPPDLTAQILSQLESTPTSSEKIGQQPSVVTRRADAPKTDGHSRRRVSLIAAAGLAALAASIAAVAWLRPDATPQQQAAAPVANPHSVPRDTDTVPSTQPFGTGALATADPAVRDTNSPPDQPPKSRGIPLVLTPSAVGEPANDGSPPTPTDTVDDPTAAAELTLVSQQVDTTLHRYWQSLGIRPTAEANPDQVVGRIGQRLNIDLPVSAIADADQLQNRLADPATADQLATHWLRQISDDGLRRLDPSVAKALVDELAACFRGQQRLDHTLAAWISGDSANASAFYTALAAGARQSIDSGLIRRLGALTLNADLRCIRCHDAYIEGDGKQQDYWAFAAVLNRQLQHDRDGWAVRGTPDADPLFYELPDGRQRLAKPALTGNWASAASDGGDVTVESWAKDLIGSLPLAHGVVNSLWQLVHGQPLSGRVVDPFSPPLSESLVELEARLSSDLVQSGFDVRRTLALIIASPATRRSVPESLQNQWATATAAAREAVDAFAAARPDQRPLSSGQRMDQAMRSIGAKLDADGKPLLAQLGPVGTPTKVVETDKPLSWDFPSNEDTMPVQWLAAIDDPDQRIEHLGYLAGMSQTPAHVRDAAAAMRAAQLSEPQTLHRLWWLIQP